MYTYTHTEIYTYLYKARQGVYILLNERQLCVFKGRTMYYIRNVYIYRYYTRGLMHTDIFPVSVFLSLYRGIFTSLYKDCI